TPIIIHFLQKFLASLLEGAIYPCQQRKHQQQQRKLCIVTLLSNSHFNPELVNAFAVLADECATLVATKTRNAKSIGKMAKITKEMAEITKTLSAPYPKIWEVNDKHLKANAYSLRTIFDASEIGDIVYSSVSMGTLLGRKEPFILKY